jgi:hypothetical protein
MIECWRPKMLSIFIGCTSNAGVFIRQLPAPCQLRSHRSCFLKVALGLPGPGFDRRSNLHANLTCGNGPNIEHKGVIPCRQWWVQSVRLVLCLSGLLCSFSQAATNDPAQINPPPGPFISQDPSAYSNLVSFASLDRLILTPYFYWYDVYSGAHLLNPDGSDALTDHPATLTGFSYLSRSWHKSELKDMIAAGIDVLLPVYWGEPSQLLRDKPVSAQPWSFAGLPPLVAAREELLAEGAQPPRIGLFYDTSTLQYNAANQRIDLTTSYGRQWFYESVRDFFSLIPPQHWALIDGKPVVFLYSSTFATRHDQTCIDYLHNHFARDFGGRTPFIVREISWSVRSDQVYAWGGALGLKNPGTASLGPGYDHSAVPGRTPLIVPRNNGEFFSQNWERFLARPSKLVMIETWNEFHEGTDIANSREYKRQYIDLNRHYADLFKSGAVLPNSGGRYRDARLLSIDLGATNRELGLVQIESADGVTTATNRAGSECRIFAATQYAGHYVYLKVDDSFKWADSMDVSVIVDFFDQSRGVLGLEFDGSDPAAPFQGAYTASPEKIALSGSKTWRVATFTLNSARFLNLQNAGADFRLSSTVTGPGIRRVQMVRTGLKAESYTPASGCLLTLFGTPGRDYVIEASSNLTVWSPLAQLRATATATKFTDGMAVTLPWRWYRSARGAP